MSEPAYSYTIKELPAEERPRERLQHYGPETLSSAELVAILLGMGFHKVSAIDLAQHLLNRHDGLVGLANLEFDALCAEKGIGPAKASQLAAAFELGRRLARSDKPERPQVKTPEQAAALLTPSRVATSVTLRESVMATSFMSLIWERVTSPPTAP